MTTGSEHFDERLASFSRKRAGFDLPANLNLSTTDVKAISSYQRVVILSESLESKLMGEIDRAWNYFSR